MKERMIVLMMEMPMEILALTMRMVQKSLMGLFIVVAVGILIYLFLAALMKKIKNGMIICTSIY